jgi:hypothetical protein
MIAENVGETNILYILLTLVLGYRTDRKGHINSSRLTMLLAETSTGEVLTYNYVKATAV